MAFTETDRVQIRRFMGTGALFLQADPAVENAINAIQSIADGGTRPDSSSETFARSLLTSLQTIDTKLIALWDEAEALQVDEIRIDPARAAAQLRREGRRKAYELARLLGFRAVRADIFSAGEPVGGTGWPYYYEGNNY